MKLAIITGANGGMGTQETLEVARAGYRVIMACYSRKKGQAVCDLIKAETGNPHIEVMQIDLADLSSVAAFANQLLERGEHIDLLMNNAGTMETGWHPTVDDLERTVSVNYVGPYLLTRKLLPLMGEGTRIVNMSSLSYAIGRVDLPDFFVRGRKGAYWRILAYANSKMAVNLFTFELARRLKDKGITVNAADPWIVDTEIIRMQMFFDPLTDLIFRPLIYTPRQGADTAIRLLLDEDKAGQTGAFWRKGKPVKTNKYSRNEARQHQLWDETEKLVQGWL